MLATYDLSYYLCRWLFWYAILKLNLNYLFTFSLLFFTFFCMFLESWFPVLPSSPIEIIIHVVAFLGILLLSYGVFLEAERRQDLVFLLGAACLLVYAIYIKNLVFVLAMGAFGLNATIEFIEILVGLHTCDTENLKRIKKLK